MISKVKEDSLQKIGRLVTERFGLNIDSDRSYEAISSRVNASKSIGPEDYYRLLTNGTSGSDVEWKTLAEMLTVGESHFFRDRGQIALLRDRILPELISRNRSRRSLRIWSAGCSTGEEPYTLATLVYELLPDRDSWKVLILGTDLNPRSIEAARRGVYSRWSFRSVSPDVRARYFEMNGGGWELDSRIRKMVTFREGNLLLETFPDSFSELQDMDLILCRNVFIYFDRAAKTTVVTKFEDTLADGGYLMTGHGDLHDQASSRLRGILLDGSLVYQRTGDGQPGAVGAVPEISSGAPSNATASLAAGTTGVRDIAKPPPIDAGPRSRPSPVPVVENGQGAQGRFVSEAEILLQSGRSAEAIQTASGISSDGPDAMRGHSIRAQAHANLADYDKAVEHCARASALDPLDPAPYELMAMIAEEQGGLENAKDHWKRVIYLAPSSPAGYLELGSLYERQGDDGRARRMRSTGLDLLKAMPAQSLVESYEGSTAGELAEFVEQLVVAER